MGKYFPFWRLFNTIIIYVPEPSARATPFAVLLWRFLCWEGINIKLLEQYVIPLDTRTKKNHMSIAGTGARCPACGKRRRQFIRQGHANTKYTAMAAQYLNPKPKEPIRDPVHLVYKVYTKTQMVVDDLNLYASLDDLLVKEKILKDDNRKIIRNRDGSRVLYDKEKPRAEIYIYEYREEGHNGVSERKENVHSG